MNIDKICEQLTIDEKIRLLGGDGDWHTYDCNGKIPSLLEDLLSAVCRILLDWCLPLVDKNLMFSGNS